MWDFSVTGALGLMARTLPFLIFRMLVYFGIAAAYVIATGGGAGIGWLVGALLIGAVVPVTFKIIMPTNQMLLQPGRDLNSPETRALLNRWGRLHLIRSGLSLVAFALFAWLQRGA